MLIGLIRIFCSDSLLILSAKGFLTQKKGKKDYYNSLAGNQMTINTKIFATFRWANASNLWKPHQPLSTEIHENVYQRGN